MNPERRRGGHLCAAAIVLIVAAWSAAAAFSDRPPGEAASLLAAQAGLTVAACLLVWRHAGDDPADLRVVLPLHALLYSGLSNVVPALLPGLRPPDRNERLGGLRMPESGIFAFSNLSCGKIQELPVAPFYCVYLGLDSHSRKALEHQRA